MRCAVFIGLLSMASIINGAALAGDKRIAFSFDDGPRAGGAFFTGQERTAQLIKVLEDGGVDQAVFFMMTKHIVGEVEQQRIRDYAAAGHVIANHSHSHKRPKRIGAAAYIADIDKAQGALAEYDNRRTWFRFPYLDEGRDIETRDALRAALAERKLMSGYVTVDTYDWYMETLVGEAKKAGECIDIDGVGKIYVEMLAAAAEHFHKMAQAAMGRAPAQMILLHENDLAAMFADDLAQALRARGWEIITADEAYEDVIAQQLPETLFSGMGRVAAFAYEAGFRADRLDHPASDEVAIDARFKEAGVLACEGR